MYPVSSTLLSVRRHLAVLFLALSAVLSAQSLNRNLILLDPAHGGSDQGAAFNGTPEKDLTLGLANILRTLLNPRNFTVAVTRDSDTSIPPDQRAATANHLRATACILVHASASGNGVHIVTSSLPPREGLALAAIPWNTAQAAFVLQSRSLANTIGLALLRARIPVTLTAAALRPLDNLTCPAVAVEIAPFTNDGHPTPPVDAAYQRRVAEAIAVALVNWRNTLPGSGSSQ